MDELEPSLSAGGVLLEHHTTAFFPERWFDLVLVLRTDNTHLYDRLVKRGYTREKIEENVTAEIMQVVLDEARECYPESIVHELSSGTVDDLEGNVSRVVAWLAAWTKDNAAGGRGGGGGGGGGAAAAASSSGAAMADEEGR